jgi:hypothetical protein
MASVRVIVTDAEQSNRSNTGQNTQPSTPPSQSFTATSLEISAKNRSTGATKSAVIVILLSTGKGIRKQLTHNIQMYYFQMKK